MIRYSKTAVRKHRGFILVVVLFAGGKLQL